MARRPPSSSAPQTGNASRKISGIADDCKFAINQHSCYYTHPLHNEACGDFFFLLLLFFFLSAMIRHWSVLESRVEFRAKCDPDRPLWHARPARVVAANKLRGAYFWGWKLSVLLSPEFVGNPCVNLQDGGGEGTGEYRRRVRQRDRQSDRWTKRETEQRWRSGMRQVVSVNNSSSPPQKKKKSHLQIPNRSAKVSSPDIEQNHKHVTATCLTAAQTCKDQIFMEA